MYTSEERERERDGDKKTPTTENIYHTTRKEKKKKIVTESNDSANVV